MDEAIQLHGLTLRQGGRYILREADYAFREGEIHGIRTPDPAAGHVLLTALAGLARPAAGKIFVDYQEVGEEIDFPEALGIMTRPDGLIGAFTALDNLMNLARIQRSVTPRDALKLIKALELGPLLQVKLRRYDPQMRQRVSFAQAVLESPLFLLLEDPFSQQEETGRELLWRQICQRRAQGATILITTPRRAELEGRADTLSVLDGERILPEKEEQADGASDQRPEPHQDL